MEKEKVILQHLRDVEQAHCVKVLLAVESGSRAWGFESQNSDWDVRFVYVNKPQWYISIERKRDVIEYMYKDNIDLVGWDLKKALSLLKASNPSLLEWFHSPIIYEKNYDFMQSMDGIVDKFFDPTKMMHHYYRIYHTHDARYLKQEKCRLKVFFYYLRGILGCRWIEQHQTLPPVLFTELVEATIQEEEIRRKINELVKLKKCGVEMGIRSIDKELLDYAQYLADYYTGRIEIFRPDAKPILTTTLDSILYQMVMKNK